MQDCPGFPEEAGRMVFEDKEGMIWMQDEIDELSAWEIEERCIHALGLEV